MENKICKIVYFDEDSVTDYVQIVAGGTLENTEELLKTREASEDQNAQATGKGGIGGVFKALLGWEASASAELSAGLSFNSNKMVKNIVKNTILTDFLSILEDQGTLQRRTSRLPKGTIKKFKDYVISAEKDSLSYIVMVSPYLSMLKTGTAIPAGEFNIAIDKLDNALRNAKGYYEFIGNAIKVGKTTADMLNVNKELGMNVSILPKDNPTYEEGKTAEEGAANTQVLDVFDVLLAGVEADD